MHYFLRWLRIFRYQFQPNKRTVQSQFEAVLAKMHKGNPVKVTPPVERMPVSMQKDRSFILIHHLLFQISGNRFEFHAAGRYFRSIG